MKTEVAPIKDYLKQMREQVESIKSDQPIEFSIAAVPGDLDKGIEGEHIRQGDVYVEGLIKVPAAYKPVDFRAKEFKGNPAQVVPGETQGSRHIWDSMDGVEMFTNPNANELQGSVYALSETRTLTHPEHGDVICTVPPGEKRYINITMQRMYAEEVRRVKD